MANAMNLINRELHVAVERPAAPELRAHLEGVVYHTLFPNTFFKRYMDEEDYEGFYTLV